MSRQVHRRVERYAGRLFGYALSLSGDHASAEDLTQEAIARALAARRVPVDEPAFRAWLFRILRNNFVDETRRRGRDTVPLGDVPEEDGPVDWEFTDQVISVITVRVAIDRLAAAHRDILALIDVAGLSYAEAAGVLQVPVGTVMSRISRARHALAAEVSRSNVRPLQRREHR